VLDAGRPGLSSRNTFCIRRRSRRRLQPAAEGDARASSGPGTPPREAALAGPSVGGGGSGVSGWLSGTSRSSSMTSLAIDSEGVVTRCREHAITARSVAKLQNDCICFVIVLDRWLC